MSVFKRLVSNFDRQGYRDLHAEMSFAEYLDLCYQNPKLIRNSWQTIYDMIMELSLIHI